MKRVANAVEHMNAVRADIISRTWAAISHVEQIKTDLEQHVRTGAARNAAASALTSAMQQLVLAADVLVPPESRGPRAES